MGSGYSKMKKQAKLLQKQMEENQKKLQSIQEIGMAGNGLVKVTLSGEKKLLDITIQPECVDKDDVEGLQDLILSAYGDAFSKVEKNEDFSTGSELPSL